MEIFEEVVAAFRPQLRAMAWTALTRVGVLDALPATSTALAKTLHLAHHKLDAVLAALAFEGDLVASGHPTLWQLPARQAPDLVESGSDWPGWGSLAEALRGAPPAPLAPSTLRAYHEHLSAIAATRADALWDAVGSCGPRLLDLGGGFGGYAAAFVARTPNATARVLDSPEVVACAPDTAGVEWTAVDLLDMAEGPRGDVALLANVLHLYGPAEAARLVALAATLLDPGGLLVVDDLALDVDGGPPHAAWFNVNMAVFTEHGRVHDDTAVVAWLQGAGLTIEGHRPWRGRAP